MYEANEELAAILLKNGFIDTTSERDKNKGKREFRLNKNSRKKIYFDYINIRIENGFHVCDNKINLSENDLRLAFLYFKLNTSDLKDVFDDNKFSFTNSFERLESLKKELSNLKDFDVQKRRQNKIERILNFYTNINI